MVGWAQPRHDNGKLLIGNLSCTVVRRSPSSIVNPPSPARQDTWRPDWHFCSPRADPYPTRLLFVAYGREATRINGNHEWLTSNVIGWWTTKYGIYL